MLYRGPWKVAPEWANYYTVDYDGIAWWWESLPIFASEAGRWYTGGEDRDTKAPRLDCEIYPFLEARYRMAENEEDKLVEFVQKLHALLEEYG